MVILVVVPLSWCLYNDFIMLNLKQRIVLDFGTENTRLYVLDTEKLIIEPTVLTVAEETGTVLAMGLEAKQMIGRTPHDIISVKPVNRGIVADYNLGFIYLKYLFNKATKISWLTKPEVLVSMPTSSSQVEKKIIASMLKDVGARIVHIVEQPITASIGAKIPIAEPIGSLILDIGGGKTQISLISMGNIISYRHLDWGGNDLTEDIRLYFQDNFNLLIGYHLAETLKLQTGFLESKNLRRVKQRLLKQKRLEIVETGDDLGIRISGRDLVTNLPQKVVVTNKQLSLVIQKSLKPVIHLINNIMQDIPPELINDVIDKGVVMTGGGSLLSYLPEYLTRSIGLPCYLAEEPETRIIYGSAKMLENLELFRYTLKL